ncbi:MAG: hypothetical protein ACR2NW_04775 [Thermodesulfobacteriota bacterium]
MSATASEKLSLNFWNNKPLKNISSTIGIRKIIGIPDSMIEKVFVRFKSRY